MAVDLPPRYSPVDTEGRIAAMWDAGGYFAAEAGDPRPSYCVMIPPPNVTAPLHLGHALNNTLQDVLVRFRRMDGHNTLWMPGTDHAGIATQTVVEKRILAEEGRRRTDFERDEFVGRIQAWKDEYEATITSQLKLMGCSCDWRRQRFTMDEVCAKAVRETFFRLFRDGLIYRGKRLVNWDPATQTVLADDEVEHEDVHGHFWYMQYPLVEPVEVGGQRITHVTVATTRPETMLGDTAVAMNPSDPRAKALAGKMVRLPIVGRLIPIIIDEHVVLPDPESDDEKAKFSTGFLKVTPAHDPDDYAIGQRHQEEIYTVVSHNNSWKDADEKTAESYVFINVMAPDGTISDRHGWEDADAPGAQNLIGMDRFEARGAIVEWFNIENLMEDVREYIHPVGHSYRSHVPIEPYLSDQWYIAVKKPIDNLAEKFGEGLIEGTDVPLNSLAGLALKPVLDDRVKFVPERYAKTYQTWLENLRDWPISRQLWWGHQIPVWRVTLENPIPEEHELTSVGEVFDIWHKYFDESKEMFRHIAAKHGVADRLAADDWPFHPDVLAFHICPADESASDTLDAVLSELSGRVAAVERDPDVLDTWFSSALWPFSTLGWPDETPEVETFYPGQLLCTAREIITLWVSRMVMMGQYCVGDIPFTDVFIHAMIQDGEGRKMSKSLGNGIDPLDIIDSHGSDAMRFTLASMTTQTQDVRMPVERFTLPDGRTVNTSLKFDVGRNFCNKLWNAARFAMLNLSDGAPCVDLADLEFTDRWILSRCNAVVEEVTEALLAYRFSDAANAAYDFAWHDFCDWYVEIVKPRLTDGGGGQARAVVAHVLDSILRLLHPFMPFITEELWQSLGSVVAVRGIGDGAEAAASIMVAPWPKPMAELEAPGLDAQMGTVQEIIRAVRNIRSKAGVAGKQQIEILVSSADAEAREALTANEAFVLHIANATKLTVGEGIAKPAQAATEVTGFAEVFVPLEGLIDSDAERERLEKKLGELRGKLGGVEKKLSNESFTAKAPAEIVERERAKAADIRSQVEAVERNLSELG